MMVELIFYSLCSSKRVSAGLSGVTAGQGTVHSCISSWCVFCWVLRCRAAASPFLIRVSFVSMLFFSIGSKLLWDDVNWLMFLASLGLFVVTVSTEVLK